MTYFYKVMLYFYLLICSVLNLSSKMNPRNSRVTIRKGLYFAHCHHGSPFPARAWRQAIYSFSKWPIGYLGVRCLISTYLKFPKCPCSWFLISFHSGQRTHFDFNPFKCIKACFMTEHVVYQGDCSMGTWEGCVFCYCRGECCIDGC